MPSYRLKSPCSRSFHGEDLSYDILDICSVNVAQSGPYQVGIQVNSKGPTPNGKTYQRTTFYDLGCDWSEVLRKQRLVEVERAQHIIAKA
jgi:hypothetical protein